MGYTADSGRESTTTGRTRRLVDEVCGESSEADRRQHRRYLREFGPAMAAYVVSLLVVIPFIDGDIDRARNYLILLPALPVALAALGLVVLGLLAVIDVKPAAGPWLVFVASMATWGLGATYLTARNS